ncbi:MAG: ribosome assembly cofactor RimP [Paludibacter sp.]|nr:ribosome assembly cofactor RimP [Paludibacter sp.]
MIQKETINQIVNDYLATTDYYLVDVSVSTDSRISVEIDSFDGVELDFCIVLSKHIEAQFDREVQDFELEVSSAGLTEPFKVIKQYEKNIGNEVEVLTKKGIKLVGVLSNVTDEFFSINIEKKVLLEGSKRKTTINEETSFLYSEIKHTKYIIRFK